MNALNSLATQYVGDGDKENLFFVSDKDGVVTITTDFDVAYNHWRQLSHTYPDTQSMLEDRIYGTICCREPKDFDNDPNLVTIDNSRDFRHSVLNKD
jgi:hypothetical protein